MKPLSMNDVFQRLVLMAEATNGGALGDTILSCDMIHQQALYELQNDLVTLLADVAKAVGPQAQQTLVTRFPYAFRRAEPVNDHAFAAELAALLNGDVDFEDSFDGIGVHRVVPYDEAGVLTSNAGVVVRLEDGSEFQITVVRSRGPRS